MITDSDVSFCPKEIAAVHFWSWAEIDRTLGRDVFTPNFEEEWQKFKCFARKYQAEESGETGFCTGDSMPDVWQAMQTDFLEVY